MLDTSTIRCLINALVMGAVVLLLSLLFGGTLLESFRWAGMTMLVTGVATSLLGPGSSASSH